MRVECKKPEACKSPREEFYQALRVRLRQARHADVLKVNAMFLGKRRPDPADLL